MKDYFYRDSLIKIDTKQIIHNINEIKEKASQDKYLYVVVKANGYGHGLVKMGELVSQSNANGLCVARIDEALKLRESNNQLDILFLGVIRDFDLLLASHHRITITINDFDHALMIAQVKYPLPLKVHIKYNTGMNRLGVNSLSELQAIVEVLQTNDTIEIEGLFTHFATADGEEQVAYFNKQVALFKQIVAANVYPFKLIHCTNSASLLKYHHDLTFTNANRCGIAVYGYVEAKVRDQYDIKGAFTLVSKISNVKQYSINTPISYGGHYLTQHEDEYIATIPIGYADGFLRMFSQAKVRVNDQYGVIVGSVCMDQLMLSFLKPVAVNDEVVLIDHNDSLINFEQSALSGETIVYEVITGLNERIPIVYY
ncbi:MAG: alanine racemase [Bacilli bacterium]